MGALLSFTGSTFRTLRVSPVRVRKCLGIWQLTGDAAATAASGDISFDGRRGNEAVVILPPDLRGQRLVGRCDPAPHATPAIDLAQIALCGSPS